MFVGLWTESELMPPFQVVWEWEGAWEAGRHGALGSGEGPGEMVTGSVHVKALRRSIRVSVHGHPRAVGGGPPRPHGRRTRRSARGALALSLL